MASSCSSIFDVSLPTDEMAAAPGITAQQPSGGSPVTVELVTPDHCPALSAQSPWAELIAQGSMPKLDSDCQDHAGRGVYRYTVRMPETGTMVLSVGTSNTEIDSAAAVKSGQMSLEYSEAPQEPARVQYALFTAN